MEVAAARELEARNELLGDGGAADDVATFKNGDGEAGACEVRGCREAIVATTDDERVPFPILQCASGIGNGAAAAGEAPSPHLSSLA